MASGAGELLTCLVEGFSWILVRLCRRCMLASHKDFRALKVRVCVCVCVFMRVCVALLDQFRSGGEKSKGGGDTVSPAAV